MNEKTSSLLIHESPLQVLPSLATAIGLSEAIILQQIHYWISHKKAYERDGRRWVYNTITQWEEQFPFWPNSSIRRHIDSLEAQGLLYIEKFDQHTGNTRKYYSINYSALNELLETKEQPIAQNEQTPIAQNGQSPFAQNEQSDCSKWANGLLKMSKPCNEAETNTETNTENKSTDAPSALTTIKREKGKASVARRVKNQSADQPKIRTANPFYEIFSNVFSTIYPTPYRSKGGDFIQLAKLQKDLNGSLTEVEWQSAVKNYFDTPLANHTLADLAVRYSTFRRGALDRFNKPIENSETKGEQKDGGSANNQSERERYFAAKRERAIRQAAMFRELKPLRTGNGTFKRPH